MAKSKSKTKRKPRKKKSRFWVVIWMLFTAFSGGGVSGYLNPDWPVVGPLVRKILSGDPLPTDVGGALSQLQNGQGSIPITMGGASVPAHNASYGQTVATPQTAVQRPADKIYIATFNIQVFGQSKIAKPDVMSIIVQTIRQFDIVAIQEIRAKDDTILPRLVSMLNADGSQYAHLIGPRLGRTVSTEQYAYVFDTTRIEHDPSSVGTIVDEADKLHREPHVARFRVRTQSPQHAFTFWLVNSHTDPDEVPEEVAALAEVFQVMKNSNTAEDDVILLGDLNASESQLGPLGQIPEMRWVVHGNTMTNTRQTKAYDNLLFHGPSTTEFTGRWGVFNLETAFRISRDDALKVSDHYPVWAEFHIWESNQLNQAAVSSPRLRRQ